MANLEINLEAIQIYVGTYKKYSEGSIFGEWLMLSNYDDFEELKKAMLKIHNDEIDAELMFQDYEIPKLFEQMNLISESYISNDIYRIVDEISNCNYSIDVLSAYIDCFGYNESSIDELIERVEESFQGEWDSDEDFTEDLLCETGSIPSDLPSYLHINWTATAYDIMMDYSTSNGYYFRCI